MKRIVLVAAAAALLVGVACAPVKPPPSGIPGRDVYVTEVYVLSASHQSLSVEVTCQLSYIHGNTPALGSPIHAEVPSNGLFTYDWRDQDIVACTARETSGKAVKYGKPSVHGASTTEFYPTPQTCNYYEGGKGNIQTCYFYITDA